MDAQRAYYGMTYEAGHQEPTKTLRDEFAMAALAGMLNSKALVHLRHAEQAATAYQYADAMLAARTKES
jgi:hypothetical protein